MHSVVLYDGPSGWSGYHPRSRNLRRMETREIVRLAEQAREQAEEGNYGAPMSGGVLFAWNVRRLSPTTQGEVAFRVALSPASSVLAFAKGARCRSCGLDGLPT